jgi:acetoin utilization deacetylase AcuC-like enzyme
MTTLLVTHPIFTEHDTGFGHPERPDRMRAIDKVLGHESYAGLKRLDAPLRDDVETHILLAHPKHHFDRMRRVGEQAMGESRLVRIDGDTVMSPASWESALRAVGAGLQAVDEVMAGNATNAFAQVRPPGHHAENDRAMGFCFFSNAAIAALYARSKHGAERVAVVDFDVHHGNGTQDIFHDSPEVLFFSTHQFPYYPGSGDLREVGAGVGKGYTINVPLPAGVGDQGFTRVYRELLTAAAERFRPDLIMVSAGYDAHWDDPLAGLRLSLGGYWRLAQSVVALADRLCEGRLVVTLEGGYNLEVLSRGAADTCRALLGDAAPGSDPLGASPAPERDVADVLRAVREIHHL